VKTVREKAMCGGESLEIFSLPSPSKEGELIA